MIVRLIDSGSGEKENLDKLNFIIFTKASSGKNKTQKICFISSRRWKRIFCLLLRYKYFRDIQHVVLVRSRFFNKRIKSWNFTGHSVRRGSSEQFWPEPWNFYEPHAIKLDNKISFQRRNEFLLHLIPREMDLCFISMFSSDYPGRIKLHRMSWNNKRTKRNKCTRFMLVSVPFVMFWSDERTKQFYVAFPRIEMQASTLTWPCKRPRLMNQPLCKSMKLINLNWTLMGS